MKPPLAMLVCLRVPDYLLSVADRGADACVLTDRFERGHVLALNDAARREGACVGQTTTQAVAAVRNVRVVVHDPLRARAVWNDLLDALDAVTPTIEDAQLGTAFLDMRGIEGDSNTHEAAIRATLARFDLSLHVGRASNRFCAYAATWLGRSYCIAAGEEASRIAVLPLDALGLDPRASLRLHVLGIDRLGELAALPHGPFVRRFGREAKRWHAWARGIDTTGFTSRGHAIAIEAAMFGEGSVQDEATVVFALRVLIARIASDLERCGRRASALVVEIELDNGDTREIDVQLAAPTAQERGMLDVLRAKLEDMTFPAAIVGLRVRVLRFEEGGESLALIRNDDIDRENVAVVLARLEALLGEPVRRARTRAAHRIEDRFTYEPFTIPAASETPLVADRVGVVAQFRLLEVREIAVDVRRGEPSRVDGRRVVHCAGPWRIDEGWFDEHIVRDEYDVAFEDDEICRIYRQGTRWYLRGRYD